MKTASPRDTTDFNQNWDFQLSQIKPTDNNWTSINLPHDWSITQPFSSSCDGATGYLPGGTGWYRKIFRNPLKNKAQTIAYLLFDGIYNRATIYLNGKELHFQPNGYVPFYLNITEHLEEDNELLITVDRTRYVDSRWYTGSGIYRNVELILCQSTHIPIWGNIVQSELQSSGTALINQSCDLNCPNQENITIKSYISCNQSKRIVASNSIVLTPKTQSCSFKQNFVVESPDLWEPNSPNLYTLISEVYQKGNMVDNIETQIGIRSIEFNSEHGFYLNKKKLPIKGVCLHQDGGLVGTAVPDIIWKQRLTKLKECGINAIRIAHHPAAKNLLTLCDQMGILVQDEFFDEWDFPKDKRLNMNEQHDDYISRGASEFFSDYAESDLKNTVRSHINHASIFMWSIGNEIEWTYPRNVDATGFFDVQWDGNYFWSTPPNSPAEIKRQLDTLPEHKYNIGRTANQLANWTCDLDKTRPITANCILPSVSYLSGYADALDVIGFSYRRVVYDYGHKLYPHLPIIGNENLPRWHEWKAIEERKFISGLFLWTGVDYMGETHNQWPTRITGSGLLDTTGKEKPAFHLYKTLWNDSPSVYMHSNLAKDKDVVIDQTTYTATPIDSKAWEQELWVWQRSNEHWNYNDGDWVIIEAFTTCNQAELFINNKSLGIRSQSDTPDRTLRWAVPFNPGSLEIRAYQDDQNYVSKIIKTADSAISFTIEVDNFDEQRERLVRVTLVDESKTPVRHQACTIEAEISDNAELIGIGNGAVDDVSPHYSTSVKLHNGEALILLAHKENTENRKSITLELSSDLGITKSIQIQ